MNDEIVKILQGYNLMRYVIEEEFVEGKVMTTSTYLPPLHLSPEKNPPGIRVDLAYRHAQVVRQSTM